MHNFNSASSAPRPACKTTLHCVVPKRAAWLGGAPAGSRRANIVCLKNRTGRLSPQLLLGCYALDPRTRWRRRSSNVNKAPTKSRMTVNSGHRPVCVKCCESLFGHGSPAVSDTVETTAGSTGFAGGVAADTGWPTFVVARAALPGVACCVETREMVSSCANTPPELAALPPRPLPWRPFPSRGSGGDGGGGTGGKIVPAPCPARDGPVNGAFLHCSTCPSPNKTLPAR